MREGGSAPVSCRPSERLRDNYQSASSGLVESPQSAERFALIIGALAKDSPTFVS